MLYTLDQLKEFSENLATEIDNSSSGIKSSIKYLKTNFPNESLVDNLEEFQVIMIGGSHLETVTARFLDLELEIYDFDETEVPKLATDKIFFELVEKYLRPKTKTLILNFAYPLKSVKRGKYLDGILVNSVKGHSFQGLIGKQVGLELEKYLKTKNKKIQISLCNDTTALGLAYFEWKPQGFETKKTLVGVVGTGFNFGHFTNQTEFVNLELGNFDKFEQSKTGKIVDEQSDNFGFQRLEKEVGGGYLYKHYNLESKNPSFEVSSTKELNTLLETKSFSRQEAGEVIIERAASLVAMSIKGIYEFKKRKFFADQDFELLVLIEGSLYWKGYGFKESVNDYLDRLDLDLNKIKIDHTRKIGLKGAARLAYLGEVLV